MSRSSRISITLVALFLPALWLGWRGNAQQPASQHPLSFGAMIERDIAKDQPHRYAIWLTSGQAVRVAATQKNRANLILAALDPGGKTITEVNALDGDDETETMTVVAENSGEYVLSIRLTDKSASGGYQLLAQPPQPATAADRDRVTAQNDYQSGRELRRLETGEARGKAILLAENALRIWQAQGEALWEAVTLHLLGMLHYESGRPVLALDNLNRALPLKRQARARHSEYVTQTFICLSLHELGRYREALNCRQEVLLKAREFGEGDYARLLQADLGLNHMLLGEKELAQQQLNQALAAQREHGEEVKASLTLQNLGLLFLGTGEYQNSLDCYEQALAIRRKHGDKRKLAVTLSNLGTLHHRLNDPDKAAACYREAHQLFHENGNASDRSFALTTLAMVETDVENYPKALEYLAEALTLTRANQLGLRQVHALSITGGIHLRLKNWAKAREAFLEALELSRQIGDPDIQTTLLHQLGLAALGNNEFAEAQRYFEQTIRQAEGFRSLRWQSEGLHGLARAQLASGRLREALDSSSQAIDLLESLRNQLLRKDLRASYLAHPQSPHLTQIEILLRLHEQQPAAGFAAQALHISERARARNLLETLAESQADINAGVPSELLAEEQNLRYRINQIEQTRLSFLSRKERAPQAEILEKEISQLLSGYETLQARIRQASPRYAALTQPQPLTAEQIQELLDDDTVLLEYTIGEKRSALWVVTADSVTSFSLPAQQQIEAAAEKCRRLLLESKQRRWQRDAELTARELSRLVLPPGIKLANYKRLVIVADGALQYIPFGVLHSPDAKLSDRLLSRYEIVNLPSASVLAALRNESKGRLPASKQLAVFSDPVFRNDDPRVKSSATRAISQNKKTWLTSQLTRSAEDVGLDGFPRLPFSRLEAEAILAVSGDPRNLKAFDFTASRATALNAKLEEYRILHFATHSLLNPRHPELSGIALSLVDEKGQPQDGFLRMTDLYNLKLNADLVVLSACRTAMGKKVKGEGLIGLTRGFMYAGAPQIVASLWDVNDAATAELMSRFYRHLLQDKLPAAAALRAAQLSMAQEPRWAAPYYWAGFVIQGDWKFSGSREEAQLKFQPGGRTGRPPEIRRQNE